MIDSKFDRVKFETKAEVVYWEFEKLLDRSCSGLPPFNCTVVC